jgi:type 1 glutamine amidotransferase
VLLSIDTEKTDMNQGQARGNCFREDNDYALAWVRQYGRGRVFYCTIAHNPYVFWDPKMLQFYLAAAQFALGDLSAPTTPSSKLTPAIRAQEKLGWRLGIEAYTFHKYTL